MQKKNSLQFAMYIHGGKSCLDENGGMKQPHILIVDDSSEKLQRMKNAAETAHPMAVIHEAVNVREAMNIIGIFGKRIESGGIDFDLPDGTGAEVISKLRQENSRAAIALFTAREQASYREAEGLAYGAGANHSFASGKTSNAELSVALAA